MIKQLQQQRAVSSDMLAFDEPSDEGGRHRPRLVLLISGSYRAKSDDGGFVAGGTSETIDDTDG